MLIFRKATEKDIDRIEEIYSEIHTSEEKGLTQIGWIRGVYPTRLTAEMSFKRGDLFVAEEDKTVVGAAIINRVQVDAYKEGKWKYHVPADKVMVLHTLVISPRLPRRGYGKQFVHFYEKHALDNGCSYLRMDTNAKNTKARAMYKKLGYTESDIVPCTFNGIEGVKLVLLEKRLG